jgi:uncharacterized protein YndB with AHSA1/START domain
MSIDVPVTALIERPPAEVGAYAMDPAHDTAWIGGIREVRWVTEPPLRVGSRVRRVAGFLGRRVDYVLEVTELVPGERLVMRSVEAPFPMVVTYTFAPEGDGTRAGVRVRGGSGPMFRLAGPLMAWQVRRNLRGDLARLRRILTLAGRSGGRAVSP